MESLPVEVVAHIAQFLQVKDVASCCGVSPWWRDMFSSDEVWRPRCDVDSEDYLRTTPCLVEPKFSNQLENSTLSPIGQWRTAYMREMHLKRNWVRGKCVGEKMKIDSDVVFLNNDIVIVTSSQSIELRDTSVFPSTFVAELRSPGNHQVRVVRSDTFIAYSDRGNTVQVIRVDLESRTLSVKHTLCVSDERIINCIVVDNIFLGLSTNCIHMWNLDKGNKLKKESCSLVNGHFEDISLSRQNNCEDVVVIAQEEHGEYPCLIYSVKELRFLPFTKHFPPIFLQDSPHRYQDRTAIVKSYVALNMDRSIDIYNYNTMQLLQTFPDTGSYCWMSVARDCFTFINGNKDLVVFSPSTGAIRHLHSDVDTFDCLSEKLVSVWTGQVGYTCAGDCKLWMVGPKSTIRCSVNAPRLSSVNKVHSKMLKNCNNLVYPQKVCFHFW